MTQKNTVKKILLVTLSNLGDVVLTLPVVSNLIKNYPDAEIHVIAGKGVSEIFEGDGRIKKFIPYDKKMPWREKLRFLGSVRRERYDLIVDLRKSLIGLLGGAKRRNSYFYFRRKTAHKSFAHLAALRGITKISLSKRSFLEGTGATNLLEGFSENDRWVVAAVGSKSDLKKWPAEYYAGLLDRLATLKSCRIILVGDKNDRRDAEKVTALMTAPVRNLCGATGFRELCGVIEKASLVITNDSAPLHIADSLKVPSLAIFGPTDPRKYGPRFAASAVARKEIFCSPCEKAQCRYRHECMTELGVDEVYRKAERILEDRIEAKNFKILVIRLDRIGDLLLSFPAIAALRARFPDARISLLVRSYTRQVAERCPWIDEVIVYRYERGGRHRSLLGYFRLVREIIRKKFDVAFILHPSVRSHLLPALCGIPYRAGFDSCLPFMLTTKVPDTRNLGVRHESDTTLDIVKAWGVPVPAEKQFSLSLFAGDEAELQKIAEIPGWIGEKGFVVFHPGASCASKRWPRENFAALGKRIIEKTLRPIAIIGGTEAVEMGRYLKSALGEKASDLTGRLSLTQSAALLKNAALLVSNDSGPVHISSAVGTKTLAIFGRNRAGLSPVRWKAMGKGHRIVQGDAGCVVCLAHDCTIDFECLKTVGVDPVFEEIKGML